MANLVIWLVVGALVGGVAGLLMRDDEDPAAFANVMIGVLGALLAGRLAAPRIGLEIAHPGVFELGALAAALLGAVLTLAIVGLVRRMMRR